MISPMLILLSFLTGKAFQPGITGITRKTVLHTDAASQSPMLNHRTIVELPSELPTSKYVSLPGILRIYATR